MLDVEIWLKEIQALMEQLVEKINIGKNAEAFGCLTEQIGLFQEYLLFLTENEVLLDEDIQRLSVLLLQAMENRDSILLKDVVKYGFLDITNQLLEGCEKQ